MQAFRRTPSSPARFAPFQPVLLCFAALWLGYAAAAQAQNTTGPEELVPSAQTASELSRPDSLLKQAVDLGDSYATPTGKRKLLRLPGNVAVQLKPESDAGKTLAGLTNAGGLLADHKVTKEFKTGGWILQSSSAGAIKLSLNTNALAQLLARLKNLPNIQRASPVFVSPADGLLLTPVGEVVLRLKPETAPQAFFGSNWPKVRPLGGTVDQFILPMPEASTEEIFAEVNRLSKSAGVVWAEPNFFKQTVKHQIPNDPLLAEQAHLQNTGQNGGRPGADIKATEAWNISSGSPSIVIAFIDDGVQLNHPDLAPNIYTNPNERSNNRDGDGNGYPNDLHGWNFANHNNNPNPNAPADGHGTCTSGCAAAAGNNGVGVAGVAYRCKILPIKVASGALWTDDATFAEAIYYAAGRAKNGFDRWRGADVISVSLGLSPAAAIDDAFHWAATEGRAGKGCPIFASSGNEGSGYQTYELSQIPAGTHTFRFSYVKDKNYSAGDDTVWLDDITFPGAGTETFEGSFPPAGWSTAGDAPWVPCTAPDHVLGTGTQSVQSGRIGDNQTSWLEVTKIVSAGTLTFHAWSSSEPRYDRLKIIIDGQSRWSLRGGVDAWTQAIAYPASHPDVIAVGASSDMDYRAHFSQFGPGLSLVAPGGGGQRGVFTTDRTGASGYNTSSAAAGNYETDFAGTSASCPVAAGVGALVLSVNPTLTPASVRTLLCQTADKIGPVSYDNTGWNAYYGYGWVNAFAAVSQAAQTPGAFYITDSPADLTVPWSGTANFSVSLNGEGPLHYQWQFNGTNLAGATASELVLPNVQPANAGRYTVNVSNSVVSASSVPATLTVSIVPSPITVLTDGRGTISPNYNGKPLEVGRTYSMTASPVPGFGFAGWSGDLSSPAPKLSFVMRTNLQLLATFNDTARPTVSILSPAQGARISNSVFTVTGAASDNLALQEVLFRVNSNSWSQATGTTHWTASFSALPGTNQFEVMSVDTASNQSPLVKRKFIYVLTAPLALQTEGLGTVTPPLNGKPLEIGRNYTLIAAPAAGQVFAGWGGGETSRTPALTFTMRTNLLLRAHFQTNPFAPVQGVYNGLFFQGSGIESDSAGWVKLTVDNRGVFSGHLGIGASNYPVNGKFWVDGSAQTHVLRGNLPTLGLNLSLDLQSATGRIQGQVSDGTWSADLKADLAFFNGTSRKAPPVGRYTMAIRSGPSDSDLPLGDGFAETVVDPAGNVRISGFLADNTAISQSTSLNQNGEWSLFANVYGGKGLFLGWAGFSNPPSNSISGGANWIKSAGVRQSYPLGFTNSLELVGSRYKLTNGVRLLNFTNGEVLLEGGTLPEAITNSIQLQANNQIAVTSGTNKLALSISLSNGWVNGSFLHPLTGSNTLIKGIVLPEANEAWGFFFSGTNRTGTMRIHGNSF